MNMRVLAQARPSTTSAPLARSNLLQRKCACGGTPGPTGECEEWRKKRVQQKIGNPQSAMGNDWSVPSIVHEVLRSPGQPLDPATRAFMEPRFGHDFGHVRVHADARAADTARTVHARAYTVGQNVVFGENKYSPNSQAGRELLAHELAHTIQQRDALTVAQPAGVGSPLEAKAQQVGREVASGGAVNESLGSSQLAIARQSTATDDEDEEEPIVSMALPTGKTGRAMPTPKRRPPKTVPSRPTTLSLIPPDSRQITDEELEVLPEAGSLEQARQILRERRKAAESEYAGMAAFYASERQSQLQARARPIDLRGVPPEQRLVIWRSYWNDRWKEARSALIESQRLGPEKRLAAEEEAEAEEAQATFMLSNVNLAQEYLIAAENQGKRNLTLNELNQAVFELGRFHQAMVQASGMILPGGGRIPSARGAGAGLAFEKTQPGGKPAVTERSAFPVSSDPLPASPVPSRTAPITPADAARAYSNRFSGRLVNDAGLEGVFARTKEQPTLSVDRRAASVELRTINDVLTNGYNGRPVAQVRVMPPTSAQRTPDLVITFADGTATRIEIRTFTAAPRGHSPPHAALAAATSARAAAPLTQSAIEAAILNKAASTPTRFSQLDVPMAGVAPGGRIAISSTHQPLSISTADAAVANLAPRLGNHVQSISITFSDSTTGTRTTVVYNRQGTTFVR